MGQVGGRVIVNILSVTTLSTPFIQVHLRERQFSKNFFLHDTVYRLGNRNALVGGDKFVTNRWLAVIGDRILLSHGLWLIDEDFCEHTSTQATFCGRECWSCWQKGLWLCLSNPKTKTTNFRNPDIRKPHHTSTHVSRIKDFPYNSFGKALHQWKTQLSMTKPQYRTWHLWSLRIHAPHASLHRHQIKVTQQFCIVIVNWNSYFCASDASHTVFLDVP